MLRRQFLYIEAVRSKSLNGLSDLSHRLGGGCLCRLEIAHNTFQVDWIFPCDLRAARDVFNQSPGQGRDTALLSLCGKTKRTPSRHLNSDPSFLCASVNAVHVDPGSLPRCADIWSPWPFSRELRPLAFISRFESTEPIRPLSFYVFMSLVCMLSMENRTTKQGFLLTMTASHQQRRGKGLSVHLTTRILLHLGRTLACLPK